jgi:hypothetical protein
MDVMKRRCGATGRAFAGMPAGLRHAVPEVNTRSAGDYLTRAGHNIWHRYPHRYPQNRGIGTPKTGGESVETRMPVRSFTALPSLRLPPEEGSQHRDLGLAGPRRLELGAERHDQQHRQTADALNGEVEQLA